MKRTSVLVLRKDSHAQAINPGPRPLEDSGIFEHSALNRHIISAGNIPSRVGLDGGIDIPGILNPKAAAAHYQFNKSLMGTGHVFGQGITGVIGGNNTDRLH